MAAAMMMSEGGPVPVPPPILQVPSPVAASVAVPPPPPTPGPAPSPAPAPPSGKAKMTDAQLAARENLWHSGGAVGREVVEAQAALAAGAEMEAQEARLPGGVGDATAGQLVPLPSLSPEQLTALLLFHNLAKVAEEFKKEGVRGKDLVDEDKVVEMDELKEMGVT
eukprot:4047904-Prymnesium_polylepis.1